MMIYVASAGYDYEPAIHTSVWDDESAALDALRDQVETYSYDWSAVTPYKLNDPKGMS